MRYLSFENAGRSSWGIVEGDHVLDLGALGRHPDLRSAIAGGLSGDDGGAAPRVRLAEVAFAPVVPNPSKILCVGHNYETHRLETNRDPTAHPSIFIRFADSQVGHNRPLVRPSVSTMFDFEGELAVVIGTPAHRVSEADALTHVAGYSCYMDASVRDWQWHSKQFTPGKNFPGTGGFGPFLVTSDEVGDPSRLEITTRVNDVVMQAQPTADMIFPIPEIIAYASAFTPLSPGDVIVTGTPGGVGAKRQPPVWLKPGDIVEVTIPRIGTLVHRVIGED